ncbi:Na+/H+ antiporter subunit D [Actinospongicola halichondriae]|uniref:Na+/H+ antiporter subunit D n=1 Tax=Actinospongicola halichondriae TaxID=3236844 RepID=UPI003D408FED
MTDLLVPAPILLPIAGAALSIVLGRSRVLQRVLGVVVLSTTLACSATLAVIVDRDGPAVAQAGGWPAPVGITLVVDRFAAIMLVLASLMLLGVLVYAIGQGGAEDRHVGFHPIYLVLSAGVAGAFVTGDLFNLFVSFEVMLTASYVLLTLGGTRAQVRAGMTYVVISLVASALFLTSIGFIYASTGTVNLAQLSTSMTELPDGLRQALPLLLLGVFGIKAAVFPLFFWLPDSYPTAPTAVTAVFAGLLTKVGVYAIIRTQTLLVDPGDRPIGLLLLIAALTMTVGVLGAIAQSDIKRILSFHIVSQIGYMIFGLALFTVAGLAGAILYIIHHIVVKTTLFLVGGLVEHRAGSSNLDRVGGLLRTTPVLAVTFLVTALSLAGIPPLSGFGAKFALIDAGLAADAWIVVAVSLVVSVLTLFSMTKIWAGAFGGEIEPDVKRQRDMPLLMVVPTVTLAAVAVVIAVAAGPLYDLTERAATDLLDPSSYRTGVLEP